MIKNVYMAKDIINIYFLGKNNIKKNKKKYKFIYL